MDTSAMDTIAEMSDEDDAALEAFMPTENVGYTQNILENSNQMLKYERTAKPINIKALKDSMWTSLDKENTVSGAGSKSFMGVIDDIQKKVRP
jgi:hypothetical protein